MISIIVREPLAQFMAATFLSLSAAAQGPAVAVGPDTMTPAGRAADSVLTVAARNGFSGIALIRHRGTVVLRRGYGMANRASAVAFSPRTVVQIGSNTKDFTKVAILQLASEGKLTLRDSLGKFFSDVPADKSGITVRHLLDHTAGFPIGVGRDFEPLTRDAFVARTMAAPLKFEPGRGEQYSNTGFSLLAAIIESRSGQTYDRYLAERVFAPVGMRHTGLLLPGFVARDVAHSVEGGKEQPTMLERPHAADGSHWNLRGNGGLLSTVDDMTAFYDALFESDRLLPRAARDEFFPNEPVVLAGSDLAFFFLYNREPQAGLVMVLASSVAEHPAPDVHGALLPLFGLAAPQRRQRVASAAPAVALPDSPAGRAATEWIDVMAHADSATLSEFISRRMVLAPDDKRPLGERVAQALSRRARLGPLVPVSFEAKSPTVLEVRCRTGGGDPATATFEIEAAAPFRIVGVRMIVG